MVRSICTLLGIILLTPFAHAAEGAEELQEQVDQLSRQLLKLQERIHHERSDAGAQEEKMPDLSYEASEEASFVNLSPQQRQSIDDVDSSNVLSSPWWRYVDIS